MKEPHHQFVWVEADTVCVCVCVCVCDGHAVGVEPDLNSSDVSSNYDDNYTVCVSSEGPPGRDPLRDDVRREAGRSDPACVELSSA